MINLTLSTNGRWAEQEVHEAEAVEATSRFFGTSLGGGTRERVDVVRLALTEEQAFDLLDDLLAQVNEHRDEMIVLYTP